MARLAVGDAAPLFSLRATTGELVRLADLRGKTVVLYFYPKDDTPGCTREACAFRDTRPRFGKSDAVVLGVSRDSVESHQRFTEKYRLNFPLLSDPDAAAAKTYGVYQQKSLYGRMYWGIVRTTFVIDGTGRIAAIFPNVKVDGHAEAVLQAIKAASPKAAPARRA